jgi:hypothetical protein
MTDLEALMYETFSAVERQVKPREDSSFMASRRPADYASKHRAVTLLRDLADKIEEAGA